MNEPKTQTDRSQPKARGRLIIRWSLVRIQAGPNGIRGVSGLADISAGRGEPDVHVVIVSGPRSHDSSRAAKPGRRADEDRLRACGDEAIEELLREPMVDLAGGRR